jgi:hypothetical protein
MTADFFDAGGRHKPDGDGDGEGTAKIWIIGPEMEAALDMSKMYAIQNVDREVALAKFEEVAASGPFAQSTFKAMLAQVGDDEDLLLNSFIATICTAVYARMREDLVEFLARDSSLAGKIAGTTRVMHALSQAFNLVFTLKITFSHEGWNIDHKENE